jgi:hypothetical protein
MRGLILILLLAGCAALPRDRTGGDSLERELAGRRAGDARACVSAGPQQYLVVARRRAVVLRRGDTVWVNRLSDSCPGMDMFGTLIVDVHGGQYCRGDRVRSLSAGSSIPGPACILGAFVPYRKAS